MNIILLSGGSGTRLWPLSNDVRSKQFLKVLPYGNGRESMAQKMYRGIRNTIPDANITIAAAASHVQQIKLQLGDDVQICPEPCRRDTFPAIVLACAYLKEHGASEHEPVVVCPVDSYVDDSYYSVLGHLCDRVLSENENLVLLGIKPDHPSEKFGYILTDREKVVGFKEKPKSEKAEEYIASGALWNGGVFAFKLGYVLDIARREFETDSYEALLGGYSELPKISFDYAVVEKESNIGVIKYDGLWNDLGTWNALSGVLVDEKSGNAVEKDCVNTKIINELDMPLLAVGINDAVIVATPDGILVSDIEQSSQIKDSIPVQRPMFERRLWGEYKVLEYHSYGDRGQFLTKHLIIKPGKQISYQYHLHRSEIWTVTEGTGIITIDDVDQPVSPGFSITISAGTKHTIKAESELHIIEVQLGDVLSEDDIVRL